MKIAPVYSTKYIDLFEFSIFLNITYYQDIMSRRSQVEYEIDGVVIKVNDIEMAPDWNLIAWSFLTNWCLEQQFIIINMLVLIKKKKINLVFFIYSQIFCKFLDLYYLSDSLTCVQKSQTRFHESNFYIHF